jgi:hypothetical protein
MVMNFAKEPCEADRSATRSLRVRLGGKPVGIDIDELGIDIINQYSFPLQECQSIRKKLLPAKNSCKGLNDRCLSAIGDFW